MQIDRLVRPNIRELVAYSSARDDYKGTANIWLNANENPYGAKYSRYPDTVQKALRERIAEMYNAEQDNIFIGNGSDEAIDIIIRVFCEPSKDSIATLTPTYGMYKVAASINDIKVIEIPLEKDFKINADNVLSLIQSNTKIIFVCSPNNPTANILDREEIIKIINNFDGIVVIDEAYLDFSDEKSYRELINDYNNIIVLSTLSKAWGAAGLRIGFAFANQSSIKYMNRVKAPYNIGCDTIQEAISVLENKKIIEKQIIETKSQRKGLYTMLNGLNCVEKTYRSDSNFILVKFTDSTKVYNYLSEKGIIVRDRANETNCKNCLRISIGTPTENSKLIETLKDYEKSIVCR